MALNLQIRNLRALPLLQKITLSYSIILCSKMYRAPEFLSIFLVGALAILETLRFISEKDIK